MNILSLSAPLEFELDEPQIVLKDPYKGIVFPKGTFVLQLTTEPIAVPRSGHTWWTHVYLLSDGQLAHRLMQKHNVTAGMKFLCYP